VQNNEFDAFEQIGLAGLVDHKEEETTPSNEERKNRSAPKPIIDLEIEETGNRRRYQPAHELARLEFNEKARTLNRATREAQATLRKSNRTEKEEKLARADLKAKLELVADAAGKATKALNQVKRKIQTEANSKITSLIRAGIVTREDFPPIHD
jgi:DNA-binding transcriptional MerR regulator